VQGETARKNKDERKKHEKENLKKKLRSRQSRKILENDQGNSNS